MIVDALAQAWRAWAELGAQLDDEQWDRPTRLEGWKVRDVVRKLRTSNRDRPLFTRGLTSEIKASEGG